MAANLHGNSVEQRQHSFGFIRHLVAKQSQNKEEAHVFQNMKRICRPRQPQRMRDKQANSVEASKVTDQMTRMLTRHNEMCKLCHHDYSAIASKDDRPNLQGLTDCTLSSAASQRAERHESNVNSIQIKDHCRLRTRTMTDIFSVIVKSTSPNSLKSALNLASRPLHGEELLQRPCTHT